MSSLNEGRNHLLVGHFEGIIDDEEFALLYDINQSDNLDLPYDDYEEFDLEFMEDDECVAEFRFTKQDIPVLAEVLGVPDTISCYQRSVCSGVEAL